MINNHPYLLQGSPGSSAACTAHCLVGLSLPFLSPPSQVSGVGDFKEPLAAFFLLDPLTMYASLLTEQVLSGHTLAPKMSLAHMTCSVQPCHGIQSPLNPVAVYFQAFKSLQFCGPARQAPCSCVCMATLFFCYNSSHLMLLPWHRCGIFRTAMRSVPCSFLWAPSH